MRNTRPKDVVNVIRAWKDPEYRNSLSASERAHLPDCPVGLINLTDIELTAVAGGTGATHALSITCAVFCDPTKSAVCKAVCDGTCEGYEDGRQPGIKQFVARGR